MVTELLRIALPSEQDIFHALADPTRRRIIELLAREDQAVHRLAAAFEISRPAISRHLRVLRRAELVTEAARGRENVYRLNATTLTIVDRWRKTIARYWGRRLGALQRLAKEDSP